MSLVGEVLEFVLELALDSVTSWRMAVSLAATGIVVWLILAYGPQNATGTALAIGAAITGIALGLRWVRSAEAG